MPPSAMLSTLSSPQSSSVWGHGAPSADVLSLGASAKHSLRASEACLRSRNDPRWLETLEKSRTGFAFNKEGDAVVVRSANKLNLHTLLSSSSSGAESTAEHGGGGGGGGGVALPLPLPLLLLLVLLAALVTLSAPSTTDDGQSSWNFLKFQCLCGVQYFWIIIGEVVYFAWA